MKNIYFDELSPLKEDWHYNCHPSTVAIIDNLKATSSEDLRKILFYTEKEIKKRGKNGNGSKSKVQAARGT